MKNELEVSRVRTLVNKIRDSHCIELNVCDDEYEAHSPDGFKLSVIISAKNNTAEKYLININDLSYAKIVNNVIIIRAYDDTLDENVTLRIKLFIKTPIEINHLAA